MNYRALLRHSRLTLLLISGACAGLAQAQTPTLTVSPSSITNDFVGKIVLTISNLNPGQGVIIQKYLDLNANGVIDLGQEPMVQSFAVNDGVLPLIGGVRYLNVPGDEDGAANGQIRVELNYPGANETLDHIAGHYLYRLVDPNGVFSPVAVGFSVLQKPYPQGVNGQAVAAGTGLPLTNAVVVLTPQSGDNGFGTVADANGNFSLSGAPGNYALLALRPGCVADQSAAVNLVSNSFMTKNLTNPAALPVLSGNVSDSGSGIGLPGLFVQAQSTNNLMTIGFTDTNGNFNLPVSSNQWKIKIKSDSGLCQLGYVGTQNSIGGNTYNGSVSNLNLQFPKATALIYGTISDSFSNTIPAFGAEAQDSSYTYDSRGRSTANGSYAVGVFAGSWSVGPNSDELTATGWLGTNANASLTNGQAVLQNIIIQRATTHLRGRFVDNTGAPVTNTSLYAYLQTGPNQNVVDINSKTLNDGTFDLGVFGGTWYLSLECQSALNGGLVPPAITVNVTDGVDVNNLTLIAPAVTGYITGTVRDSSGNPVAVSVYASAYAGATNYNPCTGQSSSSISLGVFNGTWSVGITGDLTTRGYDNPPNRTITVTGTNTVVNIILYPLGQTPPKLSAAGFVNGQFQFTLNGDTERSYRIDVTTNVFNPGSWVPLRTNVAYGGTFTFIDTNATRLPARYYRAVLAQ